MSAFEVSLVVGIVAGLADVIGGALVTARRRWDRVFLQYFLALGAGFMLAVAFLRMVPESLEKLPHTYRYVLIGHFAVHLSEHTLTPHCHFGEEVHRDAPVHPAVGYLGLSGLAIPEVNKERSWGVALAVFGGLPLYVAAESVLEAVGIHAH